jgi:microcystin-dependent protein
MSDPYVGEIKMFGGNFAPENWAFCDGSLMAISQNEALFALIGTTYGGDGQTTFAVPDLRSRIPMHVSSQFPQGGKGGVESVVLTTGQMGAHTHVAQAAAGNVGTPSNSPGGNYWSEWTGGQYSVLAQTATLAAAAIGSAGGSGGATVAHDNLPPFQAVTFIISLFGVFPSQS